MRIGLALLVPAGGYRHDLREQWDPASLQMPLKKVGQRALALALSCLVAILLVIGFW